MKTIDYIKRYTGKSVLAFLAKVFEAILELLVPLVLARMIDYGINPGNYDVIVSYGILLFILPIIGYMSAMVCQFLASYVGQSVGTDLRNAAFIKINEMDLSQLESLGPSSLVTRINNDSQQVQQAVALVLRLASRVPVLLLGAVIMSFIVSPSLAPIFIIIGLILAAILIGITFSSNRGYLQVQEFQDDLSLILRENLNGIRVIRAFANQDIEKGKFDRINKKIKRKQVGVGRIQSLANPSSTILINIAVAMIIYFGSRLVNNKVLMQGDIVALVNYSNTILLALNQLVQAILVFSRAFASIERIDEVLLNEPKIEGNSEKPKDAIKPPASSVEFDQVSFDFSDFPLLSDINLKISPGDFIGIIGPTGSGKSTLAKLILRFYDVNEGSIKVDGKDIRDYEVCDLRERIAYVGQKSVLFTGSIRENMRMGNQEASDEEIWQALDMAQASSFISSLDDKVDQGGKNFSGGQRQRLTIARALVQKAGLIIFDDSVSALDYRTEALLRKEINNLPATIILISQRISSISAADKIVVMDEGKIVGIDNHESLLKENHIYREIYSSQRQEDVS